MASRRAEKILLLQQNAVEQAVADRRRARQTEAAGRLAVEDQRHQRPKIEMLAIGHDLQRYGMDRPELLHPLDDVGQLAHEVFPRIGRPLRGGREDPERKDIDEPQVVDPPDIDPVDASRSNLTGRSNSSFDMPSARQKSFAVPAGITPSGISRPLLFIALTAKLTVPSPRPRPSGRSSRDRRRDSRRNRSAAGTTLYRWSEKSRRSVRPRGRPGLAPTRDYREKRLSS